MLGLMKTAFLFFLECLPLLAILPLVVLQGMKLWNLPHFQFFPIAILFTAWWLRKANREYLTPSTPLHQSDDVSAGAETNYLSHGTTRTTARYTNSVLVIYLGGLLIAIASLFLFSQFLAHLACLFLTLALCVKYLTNVPTTSIIGAFSVLFLCVPLPFNYDQTLIQYLQTWSSFSCSAVLDTFKVSHLREGNIIELPEKRLFVDEACSGVDSLYSLAAVALAMLIVQRASLIVAIATMLTVPFWAIMGNLIRLLSIGLGLSGLGIDLSTGWPHTVLGLAVFVIVSACHLATALSFAKLFSSIPDAIDVSGAAALNGGTVAGAVSYRGPDASLMLKGRKSFKTVYLGLVYVCAIPIALTGGLTWYVAAPELVKTVRDYGVTADDFAHFPAADYRPLTSTRYRFEGFKTETREMGNIFGRFSHVWRYESDAKQVVTSLDFPFNGWHDLEMCYELTGWQTLRGDVRSVDGADKSDFVAKEFSIKKGLNQFAFVMFSMFDENGSFAQMKSATLQNDLNVNAKLFERFTRRNPLGGASGEVNVQIQFQMVIFSPVELTAEQMSSYREDFYRAAREIASASTRSKMPQSQ